MKLWALTTNEQAANNGATHMASIDADDLTETTANTAQTIELLPLLAGDYVIAVWWRLKTAFKDASDAAFNVTTMSVGDTATGVAAHIAAKELNENGTEISEFASFTVVGAYAAADKVAATFNAMSAKSLSTIDVGEVVFFIKVLRPAILEDALGASQITTK